MSIKRVIFVALVLLVTAVSASAQSPDESRGTPKRSRYIFPVAPRAGVPRAQPANDNFANATVVSSPLPFTDTVPDFDLSTGETGEPEGCLNPDNGIASVWYSYTPESDVVVTVDTHGSTFDTVVGVYTGTSVNGLSQVRCNDDFSVVVDAGLTSMLVGLNMSAGTTYMIRVAANDSSYLLPGDAVTLTVKETPIDGDFIVDSTVDQVDMNIGDGICETVTGACTLRAAINEANVSQPGSTILLAAGTYTTSIDAPLDPESLIGEQLFEDTSINGDLDIVTAVTITGAGPQSTVIDGGDIENVFEFHGSAYVVLTGIKVRNGSRYGGAGGGLRLNATASVTATNVWVTENEASFGGGITVEGGSLTMTDSAITNNIATGFTKLDLPNPTEYFAGNGGGLEVRDKFASVISINLTNVTISGNTAITPDPSLNFCKPVDFEDEVGVVTPHAGKGGAVYFGLAQASSAVLFNNVTIANNTAFCGGGIFTSAGVNMTTRNTLIGDNTANNNPDCKGTIGSAGSNLIENAIGCKTIAADIVNQDVRLNALFVNAPGKTPTHLPRPSSPARNAVNASLCAAVDQRGVSRTMHGACDIGALEALSVTPGTFTLISPAHDFMFPSATGLTQFTWQSSDANAYSYVITLDAISSGTPVNVYTATVSAADACPTSECSANFSGSLPDGFYRYKVTAYADTNATPASTAHVVQIDSVAGLPNLVVNGGFETKAVNGQAAKWNAKKVSGEKRICNTTITYSYKDSCAYLFKGSKLESSSLKQVLNINGITFEANNKFRLSFYAQPGPAVNASVMLKVIYTRKSITPNKIKIVLPAGDQTWIPLSGEVTLKHQRVERVLLIIKHHSKKGKLLVDEVRTIYIDDSVVATPSVAMTRDQQSGGLLPPPSAPDGFRGNN